MSTCQQSQELLYSSYIVPYMYIPLKRGQSASDACALDRPLLPPQSTWGWSAPKLMLLYMGAKPETTLYGWLKVHTPPTFWPLQQPSNFTVAYCFSKLHTNTSCTLAGVLAMQLTTHDPQALTSGGDTVSLTKSMMNTVPNDHNKWAV